MKIETIVIREKILIKAKVSDNKSAGGIILPDSVTQDTKPVGSGFVIEYGEGYPQYDPDHDAKAWQAVDKVRYIPLKVQKNDFVYFYKQQAAEIMLNGIQHFIVSESAILLIQRFDVMEV